MPSAIQAPIKVTAEIPFRFEEFIPTPYKALS